jgi:hypothetical protein
MSENFLPITFNPDNIIDIRSARNMRLALVDRVNPLWYASLSAEQQTELAAYRQSLLDITDQAGYPNTIVWPKKPTWLG